jgi:Peroxisomal membrane protein (Pex16)
MRLVDSYRRFVRGHAGAVGSVELLVPWLTWLLPDRFAASELPAELVNSISGILSIIHDGLMEAESRPGAVLFLALLQQVRPARPRLRSPATPASR